MNPVFPAVFMAISRCYFDMLTGIPYTPRKPMKEPPTFPRSDMVEAMEEERDEVSCIR